MPVPRVLSCHTEASSRKFCQPALFGIDAPLTIRIVPRISDFAQAKRDVKQDGYCILRQHNTSNVQKLNRASPNDQSFDDPKIFQVMPDSSTGSQPDPFLKHHDISKTDEPNSLYNLVTTLTADALGPNGLDLYRCTQTTGRNPSLIWKAVGAKDQKYHADPRGL